MSPASVRLELPHNTQLKTHSKLHSQHRAGKSLLCQRGHPKRARMTPVARLEASRGVCCSLHARNNQQQQQAINSNTPTKCTKPAWPAPLVASTSQLNARAKKVVESLQFRVSYLCVLLLLLLLCLSPLLDSLSSTCLKASGTSWYFTPAVADKSG